MHAIPPEIWPEIETAVLDLMLAAYERGLSRARLVAALPHAEPTVEVLLGEITRRYNEREAARRAYGLATEPEAPPWLKRVFRPEVPDDDR